MQNVSKYVEMTELGLSAKGEVLVNKEFADIIRASKEEFHIPYVYFSTNGALLDEKKALEILEAGVDSIKFSINAVDAKSYESVHLVDDFDLVIKNFKNLLKLKRERFKSLKVTISSVIDLDRDSLVDRFKELIGKDFELVNDVALYAITYTPKFNEIASSQKVTKKCSIPFNELYINSDGSLGLCCKDYFDAVNFGSLLENDFMDVYNGENFKEIREMHQKSEFPDNHLCKNCLLYGGE